jgi:hypothetical protein
MAEQRRCVSRLWRQGSSTAPGSHSSPERHAPVKSRAIAAASGVLKGRLAMQASPTPQATLTLDLDVTPRNPLEVLARSCREASLLQGQ